MTLPKMHLIRSDGDDSKAVVCACGYAGTKCDHSGGYRRYGGFRLRATRDVSRVTCGTCLSKADMVDEMNAKVQPGASS